jgi:hypothetical protein
MISVLIRAEHGVEALAATLRALVPAVADSLVGDAVVLARRPDPTLAAVADEVGAAFVVAPDDSWRQGAQVARRDWILCLDDGDVPSEGWIRAVERFVAADPPDRSFGRLARRPTRLIDAVRQKIRGLAGSRQVQAGDLVHRRILLDQGASARPVRLAARIGRDPVFG